MSEHASQLDSFFSSIIKLTSVRASFLLLLVYVLAFPHVSLAQVLYGSLTGGVTDPSSAVVSGAKVRSAEIRTGVTQETTTDGNGIYRFITLLPGKYKVTIAAPGFTTQETSEVRIVANQVARVNAVLSVATASQNVIVTAEAPLLQTDRSDVRTDLGTAQIQSLPAISSEGKSFQALYKIIPGASCLWRN
jgi:hypothetical protein